MREQNKKEKEEREEAARQAKEKVKEKQKLTNFFGNPGSAAVSGFASAQKSKIVSNNATQKLIGGNQITNEMRVARLPEQNANEQETKTSDEVFHDYSVLTEAH